MARKSDINQEVSKLVSTINEKHPLLLVGIIIGTILVVYYLVFLQAKLKDLTALNAEISNLQQTLDVTKNNIQRHGQYYHELNNLNKKIIGLNKKLKTKEEIPAALENLSRFASKNGIKIEQVMPNIDRGEVLLKNKEGKYVGIPVIIGAKANYHDFGRFLNALEDEGTFASILDFGIVTNPTDSNQHMIKLVLRVLIFDLPDKDEKPEKKK